MLDRLQQAIASFDDLYGKCLQENVIDEKQYDSQCKIFTENVYEKNGSFI